MALRYWLSGPVLEYLLLHLQSSLLVIPTNLRIFGIVYGGFIFMLTGAGPAFLDFCFLVGYLSIEVQLIGGVGA
jgi:hypothetical protein